VLRVLYHVDILVNDKPITVYRHQGDQFVEGRPKSSYKIRIRNDSYSRVKAVISVDGLNVITGEPAAKDGKGYIINAKSSIIIDGWRTSDSTVAEFVFGDKKSSYSEKTGNGTTNTGVVAVAIYEEEVVYRYPSTQIVYKYYDDTNYRLYWNNRVIYQQSNSEPMTMSYSQAMAQSSLEPAKSALRASSASVAESLNNIATQMGEEIKSEVREVSFKPKSTTNAVIVLYYDDRKGLEARGIVVDPRKAKPDPFPASNTGYCKRV